MATKIKLDQGIYLTPLNSESLLEIQDNLEARCFMCREILTNENKTVEHIYPKWLQKHCGLWDQKITLPNGSTMPYRQYTVPCCKDCNGTVMADFENQIRSTILQGYNSFKGLNEEIIAWWLYKLYYAKSVQNRGKVAEWKPYERESGKLRRIPCTPLAQAALSVLLKPRLEAGAKVDAPLIVGEGGRRWDVLKLRAFEKEVLQKVVPEYAKISRTDVIRTSFEHYCRVICGMSDGSAQKLLGCKAAQTYEEWYCDYSSKVALMTLEAQLRRCHKSLICDEGKWHIAAHLHLRMKRGASVQIQTEHGVKIEKI